MGYMGSVLFNGMIYGVIICAFLYSARFIEGSGREQELMRYQIYSYPLLLVYTIGFINSYFEKKTIGVLWTYGACSIVDSICIPKRL